MKDSKPEYLLNLLGTATAVAGAIFNSFAYYRYSNLLWIISNTMLLLFFIGCARKWWVLNSAAYLQCILYAIFIATSVHGYVGAV